MNPPLAPPPEGKSGAHSSLRSNIPSGGGVGVGNDHGNILSLTKPGLIEDLMIIPNKLENSYIIQWNQAMLIF